MTASAAFFDELRASIGTEAVLAGDDVPPRNCSDWSPLPPQRPLAVVRPSDPAGVAAVMRIAADHDVPVVPQGGLTGLAGGARPVEGGIAVSLERLVGIEEVDTDASTMTVRAGMTVEAMQNVADEHGFFFALDLGARGSCTIGGNIATNAGGNRVIRYGMTRDMVLGLEVVLPDGTMLTSFNKMIKNNAGYDLRQMFIGSEGTLGIITRAVLRLHPRPLNTMAALCGLPAYGADLVRRRALKRHATISWLQRRCLDGRVSTSEARKSVTDATAAVGPCPNSASTRRSAAYGPD